MSILLQTYFFFFLAGMLVFFASKFTPISKFSNFSSSISKKDKIILFAAGIFFFFGLWSFGAFMRPTGLTRIPTPAATLIRAKYLVIETDFLLHIWISIKRILLGFSIASFIGVSVGYLAGTFLFINRILLPTNSFFRYIPPTAFVSFLIVYFGIGEGYKYAVIFFGVFFFIVQMTVDVIEDIDKNYLELALLSGFTKRNILFKVIIPSSLPRIVDLLRVNISGAWTFLVASEIVGAKNGLGYLVSLNQRFFRIEDLYVSILFFGAIGILTDLFFQYLGNTLFKWTFEND